MSEHRMPLLAPTSVEVHVHCSSAAQGRRAEHLQGWRLPTCTELVAHASASSLGWTVTHAPSGLAVMLGLRGKERAAQALALLDAGPVDWSLPGPLLAQDPIALQVVQAAAQHLGAEVGGGRDAE